MGWRGVGRRWALRLVVLAALCVASPGHARGLLELPPTRLSFELDSADAPRFDLLDRFRRAALEGAPPWRAYVAGPYAAWQRRAFFELRWSEPHERAWWARLWWRGRSEPPGAPGELVADFSEAPGRRALRLATSPHEARLIASASDPQWARRLLMGSAGLLPSSTGPSLSSSGFEVLWDVSDPPIDWRCRRRPVLFVRYGAESDRFELVHCDGAVAPFAMDRLSILARPPEIERPGELLPDEPDPSSWTTRGEWVGGVRPLHPRLLWVLQRIADAYPYKGIYIYSGYRPETERDGDHHSLHSEGRALDIQVHNVSGADLFEFCRELRDTGCGFYPNAPFVHVDVRAPNSGGAAWIDASKPGEQARYVDSWPGVIDKDSRLWVPSGG